VTWYFIGCADELYADVGLELALIRLHARRGMMSASGGVVLRVGLTGCTSSPRLWGGRGRGSSATRLLLY